MLYRALLLLPPLMLGMGCRLNGPVIGQTADVRPTKEPALASEVTLEIMTKRAPDTFISRDGSNCIVAPDVYANTQVGSLFRCRWVRN